MNSGDAAAAGLLASLNSSQDSGGLYLRFSSFFSPFENFINLDDYNPRPPKKKTVSKKKPKDLPTKENSRPIAKQFHQFLCKALKLLPDLLKRSPSNADVGEGEMQEERATELLSIYRLTIHCLLCIAPCLSGQPYSVHLQWGQLVRRLEAWDRYNDAKEEGLSLLESLRNLLVTTPLLHLNRSVVFIPSPSVVVGSVGADSHLACLVSEVVIVLTCCAFKSQSKDVDEFERILALTEQVQPWFCIMEENAMTSRYTILVDSLYKCALFLAGESKSFDGDLVYNFCLKMLRECVESPSADRFAIMARRVCSAIDVKWYRRTSFVIDVLRMSMEWSFSGSKVDLAKHVDSLLGFISNCAEVFYSIWTDTFKCGLELPLELADYLQQVSVALDLCCELIWKYIKLLCQPPLTDSKCRQIFGESNDLIKDVIRDAFNKCARIMDVLHKFDVSNVRSVIIKSMFEMSVVEASFPSLSLFFPLVKQWVKMLCKDFRDGKEDGAPFLYALLLRECPTWPKNTIVEILEQELLAYDQLEAWNPVLCQSMKIKVIDNLLMDVLHDKDFILQRARVLVWKALVLRNVGIENLSSCFDCLTEAISLTENVNYDSTEAKILGHYHLSFSYLLRAQFTQETKQDWELIQCDILYAINLLSELDFEAHQTLSVQLKPSLKSTISMLLHTLDLLSLKGFLTFHFDIYTLISIFCKIEKFSVDKCLNMLWSGRRLGHALCSSPIDPDLISRISQLLHYKFNSVTFLTKCLNTSSYSLLMFVQKFFLSVSIFDEENVQQIEHLYSCKLTVEDVKMVVSSILLDVSAKSESFFLAGQIFYDLAERLFACGRALEALSYAKAALNLRYKALRKKFIISNKKPVELVESSLVTKGELDHIYLELLGSASTEVSREITNAESCTLSPWNVLGCYLESILQVGIFHEATGDGVQSEKLFLTGKRFSILQSLPNFQIAFSCALGQLYGKKLLWDLAEDELSTAMKLLRENDVLISCKHCKLIFEVTIDLEIGDLSLKRSNRGPHVQSHALDVYRSAVRKLSNDKEENSVIVSSKQESFDDFLSKCHLEDNKHMAVDIKSHPWISNGKSLACNICSLLKQSSDSQNGGQHNSAQKTVLLPDVECVEPHVQIETKKKSRNGSKNLSKVVNHNAQLKPRRSSRNRTLRNKHANLAAEKDNSSSILTSVPDTDILCHKQSQIIASSTNSFDSGCSNGVICPSIECLRCLFIKMIKEGSTTNIIYFKFLFQRRRLLLRAFLRIAKSLEASGVKHEEHEVHGVFWQCISVLFNGKLRADTDSCSYNLCLFKLMGDNNLGDIFPVERASLLYSMGWFFLKELHPEERSTKCCSLSNVQMQNIISWLLRAFILSHEIPVLFQKVSRLIASLILLSTIDGSIPPPLCSQESLSLSHWAAFFHQASIGSVVNNQYLSFVRDKACSFMGHKGLESVNILENATKLNCVSRYAPEKLENLGEFVKNFFHEFPRISVVCISLLDGDYVNLIGEALILPSFFPAWLLITRFDASNQPITIFLPADSISEGIQPNSSSCKEFMHENKVVVSDWHCPWNSSVIDDVVPSYRIILEANFASLSNHVPSETEARLNYLKWWSCRKILDNQLNGLLKTMEDEWIGPWGCLLLGERLDIESLEKLAAKLSNCLNSHCDFEPNDNLIKIILSGAHSAVQAEACISQSLLYKGFFGRGGCCGEQRFRAFTDRSEEIANTFAYIHSLVLEAVGEDMPIDRQPVILVLDNDVQMLSWENLPILKNQEVYRMPSLLSILQKLDRSHYCSKNSSTFEVNLPYIDPFHAYYLLNPSGDLDYTQQQFEEWFQKQKWEGKAGNIPTIEELMLALENHDLYLYFGHGSGMQYIRADSFGKLDRCAAAFLMGCSSGSLRQNGCYAPQGAPLHYLFAGSPSVIANLWEVSDKDIDRFAKAMLNSWTQNSALRCTKCAKVVEDSKDGKTLQPSRRRGCKAEEIVEKEKCRRCEEKLRLATFISQAREACRLPTIIGAAVVCYGVPTILKRKL